MLLPDVDSLNIGKRLTLTFAVLVALILGGNGLLVWQFRSARLQTERLGLASQQMIAILRLQDSILSFRQRLDELAQAHDAERLVAEAHSVRTTLLAQTRRVRSVLARMPSDTRVDQAFLPTVEAIEITLPSQLDAIIALASSGDWAAVHLRLANELKSMEIQTSALVQSIDTGVSAELTEAETNMGRMQRRIFLIVPLTAISTFFIAAFFGWAVTRRMAGLRIEERVGERTRIARDLHDTLLQSFQGLMLRLQVVDELLPPGKAKEQLEQTLERADQAIVEGRNAVHALRSPLVATHDLGHAVKSLGDELAAEGAADFRLVVEGVARSLQPLVRDEACRIAREALRNAFRHARAQNIEAEITYAQRLLRLRIRDDGKGIPETILTEGRVSHYGLPGMRERARQIGAKLDIWSGAGRGTEVDLTIPGSIAYLGASQLLQSRLFGRKKGVGS